MSKLLNVAEVLACGGVGAWAGWFAGFFLADMDNAIMVMPTCALLGGVLGVAAGVLVFT